uniref:Uncharacterized protein n=1 Tax=viral metagenome TaxID=1070528 RepID=A0A6C0IJK9_9ZZZZ
MTFVFYINNIIKYYLYYLYSNHNFCNNKELY